MSFSSDPIAKTPGRGRGLLPIALLVGGIFLLDWLTPADYAVWLLYVIPILLTAGTARRRYAYGLALAGTFLTVVSFFLSPQARDVSTAIFNRLVSMVVGQFETNNSLVSSPSA